MSSSDEVSKTAAVCTACGELFAARVLPDGSVRPIGIGDECTCGEGEFRTLG